MRRAAMVMDVTGMRVEERGMAATAAAAEPELAAAPPTAAGRRAASPLAVALGALDRPIGVERPLGREKWQQVDPDVLAELGDRITSLSARLSAENRRLLALIHEFDRLEGWKAQGYASCAAWLAHRTKIDKATARERVRVARALAERPLTDAAMARGELSFRNIIAWRPLHGLMGARAPSSRQVPSGMLSRHGRTPIRRLPLPGQPERGRSRARE